METVTPVDTQAYVAIVGALVKKLGGDVTIEAGELVDKSALFTYSTPTGVRFVVPGCEGTGEQFTNTPKRSGRVGDTKPRSPRTPVGRRTQGRRGGS